MMKKLIFLLLLFSNPAFAEIKIESLPLGTAATTHTNDSFPYVDSNATPHTTRRLKLSDIPNLPAFSTFLPSQTSNANKCLVTDGTNTSWSQIANANVSSSAAIAYAKLNLSTSIVNSDVAAAAGIARTKFASGTASHVVINDGSGVMSSEATLAVTRGGLALATLTANNLILGNGTSAPTFIAPSASGNAVVSDGSTWKSFPSEESYGVTNLTLAASVGSNALTISLKTKAGTDPSSTDPVKISFRNATAATGDYSVVSVSSALSIVIPSTTTIGMTSGQTHRVYLYAINNAGSAEMALSLSGHFEEGSRVTTTAISGGATASVLYSTTARTTVGLRRIGSFLISEATAGTYVTAPSELSPLPNGNSRQLVVGATDTNNCSVTSATFAAFSPTPTVTIVPVRTKRYKVSMSSMFQISNTADYQLQFAATGSPTLVYQNGAFVRLQSAAFIVPQHLWGIYDLVAGTSYTFTPQGLSASGNLSMRDDIGGGAAIVVEEMN